MNASLSCSVVLTTCDRQRDMVRALRSVFAQSRRPTEVVMVDDCSRTDPAVALASLDLDGQYVWLERLAKRSGAPVARNTGAKLATGDVLMFLDDDDAWEPEKIAAQMAVLESRPEVGWVYTGSKAVDNAGDGRILSHSRLHPSGILWPHILYRNCVGPTSGVAIRQELFRRVGGFDEGLCASQDYDLWIRLALAAPAAFDGNHNLLFSTSTSGARVSSSSQRYEQSLARIREKYRAEIDALPRSWRRRFFACRALFLCGKRLEARQYAHAAYLLLQCVAVCPEVTARLLRRFVDRRWET